jgi:hypothetical protein
MDDQKKIETLESVIEQAIRMVPGQVKDGREAAIVKRYLEDALLRARYGGTLGG